MRAQVPGSVRWVPGLIMCVVLTGCTGRSAVPVDGPRTVNDGSTTVDHDSGNSGQTCDPDVRACPGKDWCLNLAVMEWPITKGLCYAGCPTPGAPCPVSDPGQLLSLCKLDMREYGWFCLYVCEHQGKTYSCPDMVTQRCVVYSVDTTMKICAPRF